MQGLFVSSPLPASASVVCFGLGVLWVVSLLDSRGLLAFPRLPLHALWRLPLLLVVLGRYLLHKGHRTGTQTHHTHTQSGTEQTERRTTTGSGKDTGDTPKGQADPQGRVSRSRARSMSRTYPPVGGEHGAPRGLERLDHGTPRLVRPLARTGQGHDTNGKPRTQKTMQCRLLSVPVIAVVGPSAPPLMRSLWPSLPHLGVDVLEELVERLLALGLLGLQLLLDLLLHLPTETQST